MKKSALAIRNVSSIVPDEIEAIMRLSGLDKTIAIDPHALEPVRELQTKLANDEKITAELIKKQEVRDYLYEAIKAKTGNHVILHLDHDKEDAESYILNKLDKMKQNQHINVLYLGGGHGGGHNGLVDEETNGLKKKSVLAIVKSLQDKEITTGAAILGSCYSAAFTNQFRDFLIKEGTMLTDSVECNNNGFTNVVDWATDEAREAFFSAADIDGFIVKPGDIRAKFNELVGVNPELEKKYLLAAYADYTKKDINTFDYEQVKSALQVNKDLNCEVLNHRTDLFDKELMALAEEIAALDDVKASTVQPIIAKYPRIKDYTEHLFNSIIFESNQQTCIDKLSQEIEAFGNAKQPGEDDDISEELFKYLDTKFQTSEEKNFLEIAKHLCKIDYAQTLDEFKTFSNNNLKNYMSQHYSPLDSLGPQIKVFASEDDVYQKIAQTLQRDTLTSKVISTPTESLLLKLSEMTGKPAHACADAYSRIEKVIALLQSNQLINVHTEEDVRKFNQILMMNDFNTRFAQAMVASQKVVEKNEQDDVQVAVVIEHNHDYKDKFNALKATISSDNVDSDEAVEADGEGISI
ncbi:hypothetical protein [Legionella hackeliae]|uniref:Uncharacterized protein n=1 Tax=Legionella hackeliae TaxID=449 RepID=A0A0A8UPV3_LEGHA|nr:hypothetical protein [Legionella hackeliae]KTD06657.1 hypothetical protein Lhac_3180 [Legionella hackeliae]CEK10778.1 protein of unknown function [Legionella hackeliae]STX47516.1 Uncharacterised protein [Legionella hackeliae]